MNYKSISQENDPEKISAIIHEQIERERQIRLSEEACQQPTLTAEKFISSQLINKQRVYGCD